MNTDVIQKNEQSQTNAGKKAQAKLERASALMATATVLAGEGHLPRIGALEDLTDSACSLIIQANALEQKKLRPALERLMHLTDLFAEVSKQCFTSLNEEKLLENNEGKNG